LQPGEDPFTLLRQEKRERVKHQQKQQLANVKQAVKESGAAAVPATLRLAAALPNKGKGKPTKRKELRDEVRFVLSLLFLHTEFIVLVCSSWLAEHV
jgi:regulator of ribosome biosynthesis